ncbi:MAG: VWA domain-containing protein [Candidatus Sulfotelmatobacter sp.]
MPASTNAVSLQKILLKFLCGLFFCTVISAASSTAAQSSLDDVHVTPREVTVALANAVYTPNAALAARAPRIRENVDLVLVPVSVTDGLQRLVTGLDRDNFEVFEGKKSLPIKHFSSEDAPVSVGILVDISGSMKNKMDRVQEAVSQFCETSNPGDEFFMITFSDEPHLASDFTSVPEDLQKELLFAQPKGQTSLLDAIYMGIGKMRDAKYSKKALLIVSDGGDNHSRYGEREVRAAVKESDVMIYAIGTFERYVPTTEEMLGPALLADVAETTGGRAFVLEDPREMPKVAHRIGIELRTQYVLGYRPEHAPHDGKWHKISVKLKLPKHLPFLRVRAKTGYYASAE